MFLTQHLWKKETQILVFTVIKNQHITQPIACTQDINMCRNQLISQAPYWHVNTWWINRVSQASSWKIVAKSILGTIHYAQTRSTCINNHQKNTWHVSLFIIHHHLSCKGMWHSCLNIYWKSDLSLHSKNRDIFKMLQLSQDTISSTIRGNYLCIYDQIYVHIS